MKSTIDILNDDTYKDIRHLWYLLSRVDISLGEIETADKLKRINLFKIAFGVDDFTKIEETYRQYVSLTYKEGDFSYWKLLLDYDCFWSYYRKAYPLP